MNQILFVDKSKNKEPADIRKIAVISAVVMLLFAITIIGLGIFGIVKNLKDQKASEPVVEARELEEQVEIKISHDKAIDRIIYNWNGDTDITLQGKGRTEITETLDLPVGNNVLQLKIIDIEKRESSYSKTFFVDDVDTKEPEIELTTVDSQENSKVVKRIKITARDNRELAYILYRWNDEDETKIEPREDSKKLIEEKISVLRGENTLTVKAVDTAGNEKVESQVYKGAKKPKVEVSQEGTELVIRASDEEEIQKIELTLNGAFMSTDPDNTGVSLGMQEAEIRQPLAQGENSIEVSVYSTNGLYEKITQTITL